MANRSRLKRMAAILLGALAVLLGILVVKAALLVSRQPTTTPLVDAPVDAPSVAAHVAAAVRQRTISESVEAPAATAMLDALHDHLSITFPRVHERLLREVVGAHSLLFSWKADAAARPVILCAHQDVVPVEPGTEASWAKPPFDGTVDDTFVWGRGTLDDKASLVTILEALESLVAEGWTPKRPLYVAFGHDEEISGKAGAAKIVDLLAARGVKAEAVLDEGNPIVEGIVPSIAEPVAPIGIAEKGYLTVRLSTDLPGGHSSTPAPDSALGVLAQATERLRAGPMPARQGGATAEFFAWTAPEMSFGLRVVLANTWLTWPLVSRLFARSAALDASIRTTTAVTVFRSGVKDNVVPRTAEARVNFRVLPGDTTESVLAHVRAVVDDDRVKIEPEAGSRTEPTRVSRSDSRVFGAIARTVREVFPTAVVAPALFLGATDGRQYERIADDVYRFLPVRMVPADLARIHGTDERIAKSALIDAVRFYRQLLRAIAG